MSRASILIPCRNAATTLKETLESALAQEGVEKEIIVVDDGSTDGSLAIAKSYESRGVRAIEGPRINASAARNRALETSRGDYIQYLDADDLLGADKIRKQIEVLEKHPDCVATARWGRFKKDVKDVVFADDDQLHDWTPVEWLICHCDKGRMMHPGAWLVPRRIAELAGDWDESLTLNDDGEYFARVVSKSVALKCCPGAESYYRTVQGATLSRSRGGKAFASAFRSLRLTAAVLLGMDNSPRSHRAVANMMQRFIYEVYPSARHERNEASRWIMEMGGSSLLPDFGPAATAAARLLGWRAALVISRLRRKGQLL
jgi:glycosyltransferase involved in cell wall biosynthesis